RGGSDNHRSSNNNNSGSNNRSSGNGRDQRNRAGHLQKDCKKNTTTSTSGQADKKPSASGRVFAITEGQAANTSGTITGTLFIYGHAVFLLFDTGATHSVISSAFASRITTTLM
nr:reverse transcriptase domain-containing protein [Tanacetum cinerariifolium]